MVIMDKLEVGKICEGYLTKILNERVSDNKLCFWPHKRKLDVNDLDIFHKIAQATQTKKIRRIGRHLDFIMDVPYEDINKLPEHWTIVLDEEKIREFLNKYGSYYTLVD